MAMSFESSRIALTNQRRYPSGSDFLGSDVRSSHAPGRQTQYNYHKQKTRLHDGSSYVGRMCGQNEGEQYRRYLLERVVGIPNRNGKRKIWDCRIVRCHKDWAGTWSGSWRDFRFTTSGLLFNINFPPSLGTGWTSFTQRMMDSACMHTSYNTLNIKYQDIDIESLDKDTWKANWAYVMPRERKLAISEDRDFPLPSTALGGFP